MTKSNELSTNNPMQPSTTDSGILSRRPHVSPLIRRVSVRFGGEKHKELERFIKFAFVGVLGTIVDLGISNFLLIFVFHVNKEDASTLGVVASMIGFTIAVCNNFVWNRYWTYPDSRSTPLIIQLGQFFFINIIGLGIRAVIVAVFAQPFAGLIASLPDSFLRSIAISAETEAKLGINMAILGS